MLNVECLPHYIHISKLKEYESYILRESGELSSSALASTFSDKIDNVKIMLHDTKEGSAASDETELTAVNEMTCNADAFRFSCMQ